VSAGQAAFSNKLISGLAKYIPSVDPGLVVRTGATSLRSVFTSEQISSILLAYLDGLHVAFAIGIATGCISLIAAIFMPLKKIDAKAAMGGD
jgi:predicted histidine transporter YuiF (NhaC family)